MSRLILDAYRRLPDIGFLEEERKNLAGIVLTHAHEDHFGGVFALWPKLKVPVYATPFTAALMEAKRMGEPGAPEIPVRRSAFSVSGNGGVVACAGTVP